MNKKHQFNKKEISLEFLEEKLRSASEPKVPVTLKAKLLDSIPRKPGRNAAAFTFRQKFRVWGFGASAAVVTILIVIIMLNIGPFNSSSAWNNPKITYPNDLNDPFIEDMNLVNYNPSRMNFDKASIIFMK